MSIMVGKIMFNLSGKSLLLSRANTEQAEMSSFNSL